MNFWEKVDEELKYSGKTRKELAKEANFDVSYISKGIARNGMPLADLALRISHALNVPLETLLGINKNTIQETKDEMKIKLRLLGKYYPLIENLEKLPTDTKEKIIGIVIDYVKIIDKK